MPARPPSRRPAALPNSDPAVANRATESALASDDAESVQPATIFEPALRLDAELFWVKYRRALLLALVLVVAGLVGSLLYQQAQDRKVTASNAQLATAKTPGDFQSVVDAYPGTPAAADALLLLARAQMEKGDRAAAMNAWRTLIERFPQHPLAGGAALALAEQTAADGKMDEALTLLRQVPSRFPKSYSAPLAMIAEASLLREQGKIEDARRVYQNVIASYRQSVSAQQAQQELRTLRPAPATAPAASPTPAAVAAPSPSAAVPASSATPSK